MKVGEPKNFESNSRSAMNVMPTIEEYSSKSTTEENFPTDAAQNAWK